MTGGLMGNKGIKSPGKIERKPSERPEIDYSPRSYTLREQITIGVKIAVVGAIIFLLLWLFDKR
jgi:hypothetical protein